MVSKIKLKNESKIKKQYLYKKNKIMKNKKKLTSYNEKKTENTLILVICTLKQHETAVSIQLKVKK